MSIDINAHVREPHTLAEILHRAESYVATVPHPPFVILTPWISAAEFVLGQFEVPVQVRDKADQRSWGYWASGSIQFGAGPVAETGVQMVCRPRLSDREYVVDFHVHRTRGSFCLTLLVAAAIADLNHTRVEDQADLLGHGAWVEPSMIVSHFSHHHGMTSFEELIDAVFDELQVAPQWASAQGELARHQRSLS